MAELVFLVVITGLMTTIVATRGLWSGTVRRRPSGSPSAGVTHRPMSRPISEHPQPRTGPGPSSCRPSTDRPATANEWITAKSHTAGTGGPAGRDATNNSQVTPWTLHLAIRAVLLHTPENWSCGVYCSNDRSPFPCRLRQWGEQVLLSAGWDRESIASMAGQTEAGALMSSVGVDATTTSVASGYRRNEANSFIAARGWPGFLNPVAGLRYSINVAFPGACPCRKPHPP